MNKPCKECPFRKTSARGWLGTAVSGALDFLKVALSEQMMPCHMKNANVCQGRILMANKSCKTFRNGLLRTRQMRSAKDDPEILSAQEFLVHHKKEEE